MVNDYISANERLIGFKECPGLSKWLDNLVIGATLFIVFFQKTAI